MIHQGRFLFLRLFLILGCLNFLSDFSLAQIGPPKKLVVRYDSLNHPFLFWFFPDVTHQELFYDDGVPEQPIFVNRRWFDNQIAVRFSSPYTPFLLDSVAVFITNSDVYPLLPGDSTSPFRLAVSDDSSGLPGQTELISLPAQASNQWGSNGQWVWVSTGLFYKDPIDFWVIFHWFQEHPTAPNIGADYSPNSGRSFVGVDRDFDGNLEWQPYSASNFMVRALIYYNQATSADSFSIYRAISPEIPISDSLHIATITAPGDSFMDQPSTVPDSGYYYRVTAWQEDLESEGSNIVRIIYEPTDVGSQSDNIIPAPAELFQNFPNPFNSQTALFFTLKRQGHTTITVVNLLGQEIAILQSGILPAGLHRVIWDGKNSSGKEAPSGIYFCRLTTSSGSADNVGAISRRMVLLR